MGRRAGAHARSKEPAVVGGPTTPTEVAPAQPILPAVATPPVEPEPQPLLAFAPPAPAGDEPPELMVRPPATEPLLVPARDPVVPSVQDDVPPPTPVRRRPRGEPVKQSSLLHRLGSAILLGFLSALLGVVAAAAIGIAALAVFVLIRGAVG